MLAGLVLLIHLAWIVWILLGWLATSKRPWLHIGSVLWSICVEAGPVALSPNDSRTWLESRDDVTATGGKSTGASDITATRIRAE